MNTPCLTSFYSFVVTAMPFLFFIHCPSGSDGIPDDAGIINTNWLFFTAKMFDDFRCKYLSRIEDYFVIMLFKTIRIFFISGNKFNMPICRPVRT